MPVFLALVSFVVVFLIWAAVVILGGFVGLVAMWVLDLPFDFHNQGAAQTVAVVFGGITAPLYLLTLFKKG